MLLKSILRVCLFTVFILIKQSIFKETENESTDDKLSLYSLISYIVNTIILYTIFLVCLNLLTKFITFIMTSPNIPLREYLNPRREMYPRAPDDEWDTVE